MDSTILYIEDDPSSRSLVERTLTHAGYRVLLADRALQGIDIARREQPDLILTDINLPDLTGRELTTILRSEPGFQTTPIVALTAQNMNEQREMTLAAGITGYIAKPLDVELLPNQVAYYLRGGRDRIETGRLADAQTRYSQEIVKRLEVRIRDLEKTNAELARLDGMKDSFIQLTAHELRTPFTLVYGYNRLMEDSPEIRALAKSEPNVQLLLEGMSHAITRMNGIINEILTISRIMTNQIELSIGPTNLATVVMRALRNYVNAFQDRKLNLQIDKTEWPERMQADWELLELALSNLISNAVKYTPDGGTITLRARTEGDLVRFSVKDTGVGINRSDHQTIFECFHTTRDPNLHSTSKTAFLGGGIGLGLAVCKGIIEAHGGRIWVESPGHDPEKLPGSEFIVVMPLVATKAGKVNG
jgi:signal transduction histidine kinase